MRSATRLTNDRYDAVLADAEPIIDEVGNRVAVRVSVEAIRNLDPALFAIKGDQSDKGRANEIWGFIVNHPELVCKDEQGELDQELLAAFTNAIVDVHSGERRRKPRVELHAVDTAGNVVFQAGRQTAQGETRNQNNRGFYQTATQGGSAQEAARAMIERIQAGNSMA